ncbi:MAG TPA: ATP-binding protein [Methylibium sp.]|nr:ATP-binding protein [Methylibium sp.]
MVGDRDTTGAPADALTLVVANELRALGPAAEAVRGYVAAHGVDPKAIYAVDLVLEECLMNIISHAFEDQRAHRIDLTVWVEPARVVLQMRDDGVSFDPTQRPLPVPPRSIEEATPGGLGLVLLRRYARAIDYRRDAGRNCLTVDIGRAS